MFRIIPDTNINFIGVRRVAFFISGALIILGIVAFYLLFSGHGNMGIDFAGGAMTQGHFAQPVSIENLRTALNPQFPDAQVTELKDFDSPNAFIIKVKSPVSDEEGRQRAQALKELIATSFVGNNFTIVSEHVIGPAVGATLKKDARLAVLLSLVGILAYIAIRFDFRSGVAATIATFHDVLAVLGIMYFLGYEFDLLMVTALLTLAGYSLTDTVVVYDRIRENLKKFRGLGEFVSTVNTSINEVLARTFNTSMTVLLVVVTLFFFGGEVLKTFSMALILGVIVGTYSSIFVASPIVVEWEARSPKRFK